MTVPRSEIKFLVDSRVVAAIQPWARAEMAADSHAIDRGDSYYTTTLYFDTDNFDLYFRRGSNARAKFRIRRYNGASSIFLERKAKISESRLYKRRSNVPIADIARLYEPPSSWVGNWFARRLQVRQLRPVCQISYKRMARVALLDSEPVRLTIDEALTATTINRAAFSNDPGVALLPPGYAMLELKYAEQLPPLFTSIIEQFQLSPQTISKYRLAARSLGLVTDDKPVIASAQSGF